MFVIEGAIYKAAEKMNIDPSIIQEKNLLDEGDEFPYGQKTKYCMARPAGRKQLESTILLKQKTEFNNSMKKIN